MIINGRAIAADILAQVKNDIATHTHVPVVRAIVVAPTPATQSYLKIKTLRAHEAGMNLEVIGFEKDSTPEELIKAIQREGADAVIVQLPLPGPISTLDILDSIPVAQDADVLSTQAYRSFFEEREGTILPPVVSAVKEVFTRANIFPKGKRAVVIGNGQLVGKPAAHFLASSGADVSIITRESFEKSKHLLKEADIVVSGAGTAHFVKPDMLKAGVVLIDAGTSGAEGSLVGDVDPACSSIASVFTPVPGGMGPIAVACLFKNVNELIKSKQALSTSAK
jgi:methylenetetrahydrofolate dehydrogenase (NADP+)/methenyltetrahydrofolate cyclohydrolase